MTYPVQGGMPALIGQTAAIAAAVAALIKIMKPSDYPQVEAMLELIRADIRRSHLAGREEMLNSFNATAQALFDLGKAAGDVPRTPGAGDW